jgi:hypothetical protein
MPQDQLLGYGHSPNEAIILEDSRDTLTQRLVHAPGLVPLVFQKHSAGDIYAMMPGTPETAQTARFVCAYKSLDNSAFSFLIPAL